MEKIGLNKGWSFILNSKIKNYIKDYSSIKNRKLSANVPGTIHTDLLKHKLIDDPFYADNELRLQWISELDWTYEKEFNYNQSIFGNETIVFEGVDTISEIYLNNTLLGKTKNMFIRYEFPISKLLKSTGNKLKVILKSPTKYALAEEEKYGKLPVALNSYRAYIRKAQYSFGWDWGPVFATSGIWKDVYILKNDLPTIDSFKFDTLKSSDSLAQVKITFSIKNKINKNVSAKINIKNADEVYSFSIEKCKANNELIVEIPNPKLWWCNGYGKQNLYNLEISLSDYKNVSLSTFNKNIGIRTIELKLKDDKKEVFYFILNGIKIFSKGVNWIPGDAFLNRVTDEKYRNLLSYAVQGNMNIVRVWGGGIYEKDVFYELCDELGLLVWQDFMFACGAYPEIKEFMKNVGDEVIYNVNRIQYHPSLVIWCGNNENEWNWTKEQNSDYSNMPGYKIFSKLIPGILEKEDTNRAYWESSPFGFDKDPNSQTSGNRHQWDVWSNWIDYTNVKTDNSLFVTEFGFQGTANISTLNKYIPKPERKIHSSIFEFHNKQTEGNERVIRFISAHLPLNTDWEKFNYLSQLNQAFALKTCLEHWRFNQITNGTIIWQINDTNPVTSWSLIDSQELPKIAYHFVKKSFAEVTHRVLKENDKYYIEISNHSINNVSYNYKLHIYNPAENKMKEILFRDGNIEKQSQIKLSVAGIKKFFSSDDIIITTLCKRRKILHRNYYIKKEWKHFQLPKVDLIIYERGFNSFLLSVDKPLFFADFISGNSIFSDRGFILLPGELRIIESTNKKKISPNDISVLSLNNFLNERNEK